MMKSMAEVILVYLTNKIGQGDKETTLKDPATI